MLRSGELVLEFYFLAAEMQVLLYTWIMTTIGEVYPMLANPKSDRKQQRRHLGRLGEGFLHLSAGEIDGKRPNFNFFDNIDERALI